MSTKAGLASRLVLMLSDKTRWEGSCFLNGCAGTKNLDTSVEVSGSDLYL